MDKRELLKKLEAEIEATLATHTQAALAAHEAATHVESKPEDEYDTRGLEASYLAGAQSKRAMEFEELLAIYRHIDVIRFSDGTPIASTAVIEVEGDEKRSYYLMMPKGGGMSVEYDGKSIHVITPQSPMGRELLGKRKGDQIEVQIQNRRKDFDIVNVW